MGLNVGVGAVDEAVDRNAVGAGVGEVAECKWVGVSIRLHLVRCNVGIGGVLEAGVAKLAAAACSCAVVFDAAGLKKSRMSAPFSWGSGAFRLGMLTVTGQCPSVGRPAVKEGPRAEKGGPKQFL